ncbi:hypothetical protein VN0630_02600 [Helicobacter pylori]
MKKVFLGMALAISVSMAEKSGMFLGGGFQYSKFRKPKHHPHPRH